MSIVVNTSAAKISAAPRAKRKLDQSTGRSIVVTPQGKMYDFIPGMITEVDEGDLKRLREIPSIEKCFDEEILVTGREAKKVAAKAKGDTVQQEKDDADKKKAKE